MSKTSSLAFKATAFFFLVFLVSSCVPYEQLLDFRKTEEYTPIPEHDIDNLQRVVIQPDDILFIRVSSFNPIASEPFNIVPTTAGGNVNETNASLLGHLVDPFGEIDFPVLGAIKLEGLTTEEAKKKIIELLQPHLKEPVVNIRFINFRVSVLGEVLQPGTFVLQGERMTILEAIARAQGFTAYSRKDNVLVIREKNGKRSFERLDMQSSDVFQSPFFYLQQNDVIVVEPIKAKTAVVRDPISEILPIVSGIVSLSALIVALVGI